MNFPVAKNVVHESETQRQFVRLPVPAQVTFDGAEYDVRDLSSGGISIDGVTKSVESGKILMLTLTLPFTAFSLDISIEAEVQYYNVQEKMLGCQFVNVTPDQISLLNHVIKSFMAGEIVKSGDLLNVAARENFVNPRKKASTDKTPIVNIKRQIPGLLLVGVLGVVAASFIVGNVYDSLYVLNTNEAVVKGAEIQVRSVSQGVFVSKLAADAKAVEERQELGNINGDDVKSPCDCLVTEIHRQDGEFVIAGDPIVSLIPKKSTLWISASLKPADASRLTLDNAVKISIAGTKLELTGKVASIKSESNVYGSPMAQIRIIPDEPLPIDLAGRPAKVEFVLQ